MKSQNYSTTIQVNATTDRAFDCINNVTQWWTDDLKGNSYALNDEFTVQFGDIHRSTQRLTELLPAEKIVWLVTESRLSFLEDKSEWDGSKIRFDIYEEAGKTYVRFTHVGLIPEVECFDACSTAWGQYIQGSLVNYINTGKGKPTLKSEMDTSMKK